MTFEPACMDAAELALWHEANAKLWHPTDRPCRDCPVAFALEMRGYGQCNGSPTLAGRSRAECDPALERRREQWRRSQATRRARATAVDNSRFRWITSPPSRTNEHRSPSPTMAVSSNHTPETAP